MKEVCSLNNKIQGGSVTWDQFKEQFYEQYFFANTRYNKQAKFHELEIGTDVCGGVRARIYQFAHFAPKMMATEEDKTKRFIKSLKDELRGLVQP